jgi:hypothetical protein
MRGTIVGLALLVAGVAGAAEQRPVWNGSWIAAAGPQVFRGNWSARALPNDANAAVGSWTLVNDAGDVVMQGTWQARKAARAWRGTWQAKAQPTGGTYAGTWQATPPPDFKGKTFEDLLQAGATLARRAKAAPPPQPIAGGAGPSEGPEVQMSGSWRMGRASGNWWLKPLE